MQSSYDFPPSKARACRWAAAFFALVGAIALATPIGLIALTGDPTAQWQCGSHRECGFTNGSLAFLEADEQLAIASSPAAAERLADHASRWSIRIGEAILSILAAAPFAALMFGVAMSLRAFGTARGIAGAIGWMRLAAWAAVIAAIAPPIIGLLRSILLLPSTPHGPGYQIEIDGGHFLLHLLLAFASFAVVWALDAGREAQRDLAEIV